MGLPVHIVLQARINSTRLPGKALLPIGGLPSAVLAALRASRSGLPLTVAVPDTASSDPLAAAFQSAGLRVFRGDEQDVLGRFVAAAQDLPDETLLIRLTGDNVFPDSDFVALLADTLTARDAGIIGTHSAKVLPYGLSVEAFRLSGLRRAAAATNAAFDREHVTPWLYRNLANAAFDRLDGEKDLSCLRCTLDVPDDYQTLLRVFDGVRDPVGIGWRDLVERLASLSDAPKVCIPRNSRGASRLVLGTAQLGAPYGLVRETQPPSPQESVALVRGAIRHGVTHIDTAHAYPGSEERLGAALADGWTSRVQVITKLSLLGEIPGDASPDVVRTSVEASVSQSCRNLDLTSLPILLLHRAVHLRAWNGAAWQRLLELQRDGRIGLLGVSVQSVEEAREALAIPAVRHIQLACNILDTRWEEAGIPALAAARPDVTVHARGALLQGVLLAKDKAGWPKIAGLDVTHISAWLAQMAAKFERRGIADLCYAWLRAQDWIDAVVVGMENELQLLENVTLFAQPQLDEAMMAEIAASRPVVPSALLNPALWPRISA